GYRASCQCLPLPGNTTAFAALFLAVLFRIIVQIVEFIVLRLTCAGFGSEVFITTLRRFEPDNIREQASTLGGWFSATERNRKLVIYRQRTLKSLSIRNV